MARKTKSVSKSQSTETRESVMRGAEDRSDDPLFVPHLEDLELAGPEAAGGAEYGALLESICGTVDDSQEVEQYDGTLGVTQAFVATHEPPVCQVQWNDNLGSIYTNPGTVSGVRWGTGTMISNDIMITCGHLFDQTGGGWQRPRVNGSSNIISPQEIATNMRVNFNYQRDTNGNIQPEQSFAITQLIEYRLNGLDMAICRIAGNPGAIFGTAAVSSTDAAPPDMICIIGHPAGNPKRIEAGPTTTIQGDRIRYNDIDTLGGNSGSGILRASDGRLVGVHTNGGCNPQSPGPGGGSNFGLRIESFIAASPTLQGMIKSKLSDDIKVKALDDTAKLKASDDLKLKFLDDRPKFKFRDDLKRKNLDDVKNAALDKGGLDRIPSLDPRIRTRGGLAGGGARPFALQTPHHASALAGAQGGNEMDEVSAAFSELHAQIQAMSAQLAEMEAALEEMAMQLSGGGTPGE